MWKTVKLNKKKKKKYTEFVKSAQKIAFSDWQIAGLEENFCLVFTRIIYMLIFCEFLFFICFLEVEIPRQARNDALFKATFSTFHSLRVTKDRRGKT